MQNREVLSSTKRYVHEPNTNQRNYRSFLIVDCLFHSDDLKDLVSEVASLKEQNEVMEMELKEMQERYSDISVRFAEVEGERQRLVMTVRNLKNAKRS